MVTVHFSDLLRTATDLDGFGHYSWSHYRLAAIRVNLQVRNH
jgi:hypothetical protein